MRKIVLFLLVALIATVSFGFEFRGIPWKSSVDDVLEQIDELLYTESGSARGHTWALLYENVLGHKALMGYGFLDEEFSHVIFMLEGTIGGEDAAYEMFLSLKEEVTKKYGDPFYEDEGWESSYYKGVYSGEYSTYDLLIAWDIMSPLAFWVICEEGVDRTELVSELISDLQRGGNYWDAMKKMGDNTIILLQASDKGDSMTSQIMLSYAHASSFGEYMLRTQEPSADTDSTF